MRFYEKIQCGSQKVFDMAMLGITKRGADGFGSTGGITKVIISDDSDSENNENQMLILPKNVISQADWIELEKKVTAAQNDELEITEEKAKMMTDDGKIIIDEKI